jgi:DNA repair exonuclease SbcCD ATPase subunit
LRIINLYLENFKTIEKLNLDFNKKIILLEGKAGQGKTSILEAIVYVLTDNLNEKISEFMRLKKYPFLIKCEFEHLSHNYKMEINSTKTGANKKLIIDNNEQDVYVNSNATKKLAEIINPTITKYSAVSEQGQSTLLLFQKPAERLRQFKEILGIDNIAFIVEKIKEDIKTNKNNVDIINAELNILKNKTFSFQEIPEIIDNESELKTQIEKLQSEKEKFELQNKLYEKYLSELKNYESVQNDLSLNKINIKAYESELSTIKESLKQIPNYDSSVLTQLLEQVSSIEKEKIQYDNQLKSYNDAQTKIQSLNKKIEQLKERQKKYIQIEIPICDREKDLNNIQEDIKNCSVDFATLKQKIELVKKGKCPTCGQDFKEFNVNELESTFNLLTDTINVLKNTEKQILDNISLKNKAIELNNSNKIKFEADENLIAENQSQLDDLLKVVKPIEKTFGIDSYYLNIQKQKDLKKEYDSVIDFNKKINDNINKFQNAIEVTNIKIKDLEKVVKPVEVEKPIEFDVKGFEKTKSDLIILQQKKKEIERIRTYNESIKVEKELNSKNILEKENQVDKIYTDNRILESSKDVIDKEFSGFVIDRGCEFIKSKMNDFFQKSYGRYEVTFKQDKNSIDFFYNEIGGIPRPVTMASGFEKQILSISLRVALMSLGQLELFIGDEIDSEAGTEDSIKMLHILFNESKIKQAFLITHKDEVKEFIEQRDDSQKISLKNGQVI